MNQRGQMINLMSLKHIFQLEMLFSRNFHQKCVTVDLCNFHTAQCRIKQFSITVFEKYFVKSIITLIWVLGTAGASLTVRPVRLKPLQYYRFTNIGRFLKSPKYEKKKLAQKKYPP